MILGIDFDGTLCEHAYPNIGEPNVELINILIVVRKIGAKLILWTCRDGIELTNAVKWCKNLGLEFDAVNDNLSESKEKYTRLSQKIYADYYIDDKNFSIEDFIEIHRHELKKQ